MVSEHLKKILGELSAHKENSIYGDDKGPSISVNKLTGKAGTLYEKLRYMVDYKEEHTIRRNAIERILKRKLLGKIKSDFGLSLLRELVSSGYLPNDKVPEGAATDVQKIVDKYLLLGHLCQADSTVIAGLMASELEKFLYSQITNDLVLDLFYNTVFKNIKYTVPTSEADLSIQTYIGCRRSLLEDDQETLLYAVLVKHIPTLPSLMTEEEVRNIAPEFRQMLYLSSNEIQNPLGWKICLSLKNYSIYFSVIREIIKTNKAEAEAVFEDDTRLPKEIRKILDEKYWQQFRMANKSGTRAVAYILLTKVVLALVVELPYEQFVLHSINYVALGTNIIFHPFLLLLIVKSIKWPAEKNTELIISGVKNIARDENIKPIYIKERMSDVNIILKITYGVLYAVMFLVTFGLILWGLKALEFNMVSIALFMLFLTFVSYLGFRIRYNARKWILNTSDENVRNLLWNLFTVPIVRTGRWLNRKFSSVNIFVFFMDFILETPFKFVLGTFDSFVLFLREERNDPY